VEHRGYNSDISIFPGKELNHKMTGNIVELCPVGCLIDKDFLFHSRVWNLTKTKSICPGCSTGCNINLECKNNKIYRIRSRENAEVNDYWICDDGRYLYHRYEEFDRITHPMKKAGDKLNKTSWQEAISILKDRLALLKRSKEISKLAVVGSAFASNEENYLLHKIFHDELNCDKFFVYQNEPQGENEVFKSNFTIHADKSPNQKGANLFLGDKTDFWQAIKKGDVEVLIFLGNDLNLKLSDQQKDLLKKLDFLAVLDLVVTDLSKQADVVLPITYFAEQDGSYINYNNQLQKFKKAINPPEDIQPGWQILLSIYKAFNEKIKMVSVSDIVNDMAENEKALEGISFFKIGDQGVQVS
jgi:NADH-quinone oxidoreductase subunit G